MKTVIYSSFLFLFPLFVSANVVINEIAWMGTANSASDEWIELYSVGNVDLAGWHLVTEDGAMDIALSGSITAGGFFLIERTDDTTVPNIPADFVTPFGSGLSNSGEILALKNAEGAVVDRVDASSGWPAGDNVSKDTMQKSAPPTSGGWVTASATPKAGNNTSYSVIPGSTRDPEESKTEHNTDSGSGGGMTSGGADESYVQPENLPRIKADAGEDQHAAVGEEIQFRGNAWGLENELLESARYAWNFGDGAIYEGRNVGHVYMFPGTYAVRVTVSSGKYSAFDDLRVVVGKNKVLINEVMPGEAGWIELHNSGSEPIHMGGWIVEASDGRFVIPIGTTIASDSFAVLSTATTHLVLKEEGDHLHLFYPNGTYANGINYVFNAPHGMSVADNAGVSAFTEPTPGEENKFENRAVVSTVQHAALLMPPKESIVQKSLPKQITAAAAESEKPLMETNVSTAKKASTSQPASLAAASPFSKTHRETFWFGGSLIAGGLAAVGVVLFRRRKVITNDTIL